MNQKKREKEPFDTDYYFKTDTENYERLKAIDEETKEKGEILYHYFTEPYADGNAIFEPHATLVVLFYS